MARFEMQLPTELIKGIENLDSNADNIFGQMVKAGGEEVMKNVKSNIPPNFANSEIMNCLKITKVYKTPSDRGINVKVMFAGYFTNEHGVKTPAELVCNVFEYGTSKYSKRPFFRKSFKKAQIEKAMQSAEKREMQKYVDFMINDAVWK